MLARGEGVRGLPMLPQIWLFALVNDKQCVTKGASNGQAPAQAG